MVGAKANVGAGTITIITDGFRKSTTTIGAGAFIGSNSALGRRLPIRQGRLLAPELQSRVMLPRMRWLLRTPQNETPGAAARFRSRRKSDKTSRAESKLNHVWDYLGLWARRLLPLGLLMD